MMIGGSFSFAFIFVLWTIGGVMPLFATSEASTIEGTRGGVRCGRGRTCSVIRTTLIEIGSVALLSTIISWFERRLSVGGGGSLLLSG